jgi:hypothetical protein
MAQWRKSCVFKTLSGMRSSMLKLEYCVSMLAVPVVIDLVAYQFRARAAY